MNQVNVELECWSPYQFIGFDNRSGRIHLFDGELPTNHREGGAHEFEGQVEGSQLRRDLDTSDIDVLHVTKNSALEIIKPLAALAAVLLGYVLGRQR